MSADATTSQVMAAQDLAARLRIRGRRVERLMRIWSEHRLGFPPLDQAIRPVATSLPVSALPLMDPWRSLGTDTPGEWRAAVRLLDGRGAELKRRVEILEGDRRKVEIQVMMGEERMHLSAIDRRLLPLYGVDGVDGVDGEWAVLCEGIPATDALVGQGVPAVGTLTGPTVAPSRMALAVLAQTSRVVLWPAADAASAHHLSGAASKLAALGVGDVRKVPPSAPPPATASADAQEILAASRPWSPTVTGHPLTGIRPGPPSVPDAQVSLSAEDRPRTHRLVADPPIVRLVALRQAADRLQPLLDRLEEGEALGEAERSELITAARLLTETMRSPSGAGSEG